MNANGPDIAGTETAKETVLADKALPAINKSIEPAKPETIKDVFRINASEEDMAKIRDGIVSDKAFAFGESAFHVSLLPLNNGVTDLPLPATFFHYKGGRKMKDALQGPDRKAALDNLLASLITENIALSQSAMVCLMDQGVWDSDVKLDRLMKLLDFKAKCETQVIRAIETMHKLASLPGIRVSHTGQVNIGGVQQVVNGGGKLGASPDNGKGLPYVD